MLLFLIFLGIAVPATELFLLVMISHWIGFYSTLGIIIGTGVIGAVLWRWQGFGVLGRFRTGLSASILEQMTGGGGTDSKSAQSPIDAMFDGAMIFFAGGLLLTPGVITDVVGLLLLIPLTRSLVKHLIFRSIKKRFQVFDFTSQIQGMSFGQDFGPPQFEDDDDIIEGEIVSRSSDDEKIEDKSGSED